MWRRLVRLFVAGRGDVPPGAVKAGAAGLPAGVRVSSEAVWQPDAREFEGVLGPALVGRKKGKDVEVVVCGLGELGLVTGAIVAADGAMLSDGVPFQRRVGPGRYPVFVAVARLGEDERIAFAQVRFSDGKVVRWEVAVVVGLEGKSSKGKFYGYGVDSGTGAFADPAVAEVIEGPGAEAVMDRVAGEMSRVYRHTRQWVRVDTPAGSAVMFSSGYGDGCYPSYFGLDERGEAVVLVTDFGVVECGLDRVAVVP